MDVHAVDADAVFGLDDAIAFAPVAPISFI